MKQYLLIVLIYVHYGNASKFSKEECQAMLVASDKCQQDIYGHHFEKMPTSSDDIKVKYCDNAMKWLQCALSWRDCSPRFERTVIGISGMAQRKLLRDSCRSTESRKQLSDNFACMDSVSQDDVVFLNGSNVIAKQVSDDIIALLDLASAQPADRLLAQVCCTGHFLLQHLQTKMTKECNKRGIKLVGDHFYTKFIRTVLSDLTELICGKYGSAEVCRKQEAEMWEELRSTVESRDVPSYSYSTVIGVSRYIGWLSTVERSAE